ncbi:AAA family ATPase [Paludibacterium paludis]|uniref:Chromosome partitioning protein ParA n=1 Tax=Paludibacterium paludis TaxID=1225769 RepID=A0A918NXL7_9NEIS|nr:AAA family ATPase [Paludibacterium paludis]GGY03938.1 chromosome partitioning protein ParA [Paludibacterium paludis]
MSIILMGVEKGGCGKSTMATNMAVVLAQRGLDVMLLDADPQGSASNWVARRNSRGQDLPVVNCVQKTGEVFATLRDLANRYDVVIADAGGRDSKELRSAMVAADVLLMPLQASIADLETMDRMAKVIELAKAMNTTLQVQGFVSRGSTNITGRETQEARAFLGDCDGVNVLDTVIRDRKIYRDALLEGLGVTEMNNSKARAEVQLLVDEVWRTLT